MPTLTQQLTGVYQLGPVLVIKLILAGRLARQALSLAVKTVVHVLSIFHRSLLMISTSSNNMALVMFCTKSSQV